MFNSGSELKYIKKNTIKNNNNDSKVYDIKNDAKYDINYNINNAASNPLIPDINNEEHFANSDNFNFTFNDTNNTAILTGLENTSLTSIIIPNTVIANGKTYIVNEIGDYAFESRTSLTGTLTIPNSIITIGKEAFCRCGFSYLIFASTSKVQTIGDGAFYDCTSLTGTLTIPNSIITIGKEAFCRCVFTGLIFASTSKVQTIGDGAFYDCTSLTGTLTIPNSITSIGEYAFESCGFTGLIFASTSKVQTIGNKAFYNSISLTGTLTIPNSVTIIGREAFRSCGFTGLIFASTSKVQTISYGAFYNCTKLTGTLTLPNSITTIGEYAFEGCSFTSLLLPTNVSYTTISFSTFKGCSKLSGELIIPNNITTINDSAFFGCSSITKLTFAPTSKVQTIGNNAFNKCAKLTGTLTIPNSIMTISNNAFTSCAFTGLIFEPTSKVQTIGDNAFGSCTSLTGTLTIPNSITTIGKYAFTQCAFTGLIFEPTSKVQTIGDNAFGSCTSLTGTLTIPNSIMTIGKYAFMECAFTGLTLPTNVLYKTISSSVFALCTKLTGNLIIPVNITTIDKYAFNYSSKFSKVSYFKDVVGDITSIVPAVEYVILDLVSTALKSESYDKLNYSKLTEISIDSGLLTDVIYITRLIYIINQAPQAKVFKFINSAPSPTLLDNKELMALILDTQRFTTCELITDSKFITPDNVIFACLSTNYDKLNYNITSLTGIILKSPIILQRHHIEKLLYIISKAPYILSIVFNNNIMNDDLIDIYNYKTTEDKLIHILTGEIYKPNKILKLLLDNTMINNDNILSAIGSSNYNTFNYDQLTSIFLTNIIFNDTIIERMIYILNNAQNISEFKLANSNIDNNILTKTFNNKSLASIFMDKNYTTCELMYNTSTSISINNDNALALLLSTNYKALISYTRGNLTQIVINNTSLTQKYIDIIKYILNNTYTAIIKQPSQYSYYINTLKLVNCDISIVQLIDIINNIPPSIKTLEVNINTYTQTEIIDLYTNINNSNIIYETFKLLPDGTVINNNIYLALISTNYATFNYDNITTIDMSGAGPKLHIFDKQPNILKNIYNALGKCINVTTLNLGNSFKHPTKSFISDNFDTFITNLGYLKKITKLNLAYNDIDMNNYIKLGDGFSYLTLLENLELQYNVPVFSENDNFVFLTNSFSNMTKLQYLEIGWSKLGDNIVNNILGNISSYDITHLFLGNTEIANIPNIKQIKFFTKLNKLYLAYNKINLNTITELADGLNIENSVLSELHLSNNPNINDDGMFILSNMINKLQNLNLLSLNNNNITNTGIRYISPILSKMNKLTTIYIQQSNTVTPGIFDVNNYKKNDGSLYEPIITLTETQFTDIKSLPTEIKDLYFYKDGKPLYYVFSSSTINLGGLKNRDVMNTILRDIVKIPNVNLNLSDTYSEVLDDLKLSVNLSKIIINNVIFTKERLLNLIYAIQSKKFNLFIESNNYQKLIDDAYNSIIYKITNQNDFDNLMTSKYEYNNSNNNINLNGKNIILILDFSELLLSNTYDINKIKYITNNDEMVIKQFALYNNNLDGLILYNTNNISNIFKGQWVDAPTPPFEAYDGKTLYKNKNPVILYNLNKSTNVSLSYIMMDTNKFQYILTYMENITSISLNRVFKTEDDAKNSARKLIDLLSTVSTLTYLDLIDYKINSYDLIYLFGIFDKFTKLEFLGLPFYMSYDAVTAFASKISLLTNLKTLSIANRDSTPIHYRILSPVLGNMMNLSTVYTDIYNFSSNFRSVFGYISNKKYKSTSKSEYFSGDHIQIYPLNYTNYNNLPSEYYMYIIDNYVSPPKYSPTYYYLINNKSYYLDFTNNIDLSGLKDRNKMQIIIFDVIRIKDINLDISNTYDTILDDLLFSFNYSLINISNNNITEDKIFVYMNKYKDLNKSPFTIINGNTKYIFENDIITISITTTTAQQTTTAGEVTTTAQVTTTAGEVTTTAGEVTTTAAEVTTTAGGVTTTAGGVTTTAGGVTTTAGGVTTTAGGVTTTAAEVTTTREIVTIASTITNISNIVVELKTNTVEITFDTQDNKNIEDIKQNIMAYLKDKKIDATVDVYITDMFNNINENKAKYQVIIKITPLNVSTRELKELIVSNGDNILKYKKSNYVIYIIAFIILLLCLIGWFYFNKK